MKKKPISETKFHGDEKMKVTTVMATIFSTLVLGTALLSNGAGAGERIPGVSSMLAAAQIHKGEGTVIKINKRKGKIQLSHGPIASIGWKAMLMFFDLENHALLKNIKKNDKVSFEFYKTNEGRFVITRITRMK